MHRFLFTIQAEIRIKPQRMHRYLTPETTRSGNVLVLQIIVLLEYLLAGIYWLLWLKALCIVMVINTSISCYDNIQGLYLRNQTSMAVSITSPVKFLDDRQTLAVTTYSMNSYLRHWPPVGNKYFCLWSVNIFYPNKPYRAYIYSFYTSKLGNMYFRQNESS